MDFLQEANELLENLQRGLLELENGIQVEAMRRLLHSLHTLKGSGSIFGLSQFCSLAHKGESFFKALEENKIEFSKKALDLGFQIKDELERRLSRQAPPPPSDQGTWQEQAWEDSRLEEIISYWLLEAGLEVQDFQGNTRPKAAQMESPGEAEKAPEMKAYRLLISPKEEAFMQGCRPASFLQGLAELGRHKVLLVADKIPALDNFDFDTCYAAWEVFLAGTVQEAQIRDYFVFFENQLELKLEELKPNPFKTASPLKLGEVLLSRKVLGSQELAQALHAQGRLGDYLLEKGLIQPQVLKRALEEQRFFQQVLEDQQSLKAEKAESKNRSVRVSLEKLENLLEAAGDLAACQEKLKALHAKADWQALGKGLEDLEKLSLGLGQLALELQLVQLESLFPQQIRLIRDLSAKTGKELELELKGGETEIDKSASEVLKEVLVHLLRNAVDHGIEPPEERERLRKPRKGLIQILARQSNLGIQIEVKDDGRGINIDLIRKKALEKQLISSQDLLSPAELRNLIFVQGFSTSSNVDEVSGRGIGMDLVKSRIESLQGQIELESLPGKSTCFRIKIPLVLSLVEVLLSRCGDLILGFPLAEILEIQESPPNRGQSLWDWQGQKLGLIDLKCFYAAEEEEPENPQLPQKAVLRSYVVVLGNDQGKIAVLVDEVLHSVQGMLKALGAGFKRIPGLAGSLSYEDGKISWVINSSYFITQSVSGKPRLQG